MAEVEFHPIAIEEARAARWWYARVSPNLAAQFMLALDSAIARIGTNLPGYPEHIHGTRAARLKRFPYLLVYLEKSPDRAMIIAVAHKRRRPGYWRRRLP